jgi:hypothetical protein
MRNIYETVTNQILDELNAGTRPWSLTPGLNVPANAVTGRSYNGINRLLLWTARSMGWPQPRFQNNPRRCAVREHPRRDGCVTLYADSDDDDFAIVEPLVAAFTTNGCTLHCSCGAPLKSWSWRCSAGGIEICCARCHCVHGQIQLGTKVYHR